MGSPSTSLATLRPDISDSFQAFDLEQNIKGFVWDQLMPVLDVASASGNFGRIPIEQLLQQRDTIRTPGSGYARGKWTFLPDSYATQEHGAEEPIDDNEAKMYAEYFDAELVSALRARSAVLLNAERRVINALLVGAGFGSANAAIKWNLPATATPISDVETAVNAVYTASGLWPNTIGMSYKTFRLLRNCQQIIDRITAAGAGSAAKASDVTTEMIAQVFDLEKVVIAGSSYNTAKEGQTAVPTQIWDETKVFVGRTANGNDFREPCVGRTFHWSADGSQIAGTVETYRDEPVRSDVVRVRHQTAEKILYVPAGRLIGAVV
jgi:hypothetical protein